MKGTFIAACIVAALATIATLVCIFASIWTVDAELSNRLSETAFVSFLIAFGTGACAALLFDMRGES